MECSYYDHHEFIDVRVEEGANGWSTAFEPVKAGGGEGAEKSRVDDGLGRLVVGLYLRTRCECSEPAFDDGDES